MPSPNLAIVTAEPGTKPASPPLPPLRAKLAAALTREAVYAAKITQCEAALARCRERIAAVTAAQDALEALEATHRTAAQRWAAAGAEGDPPPRDSGAFDTARAAITRAEADADATAVGKTAVEHEVQQLYAARAAVGNETAALMREIEGDAVQRLLVDIAGLERRRAALRAAVAGLMHRYAFAGMRGDGQATRLANDLRNKLAVEPAEPTNDACRAAQGAWQNFADRLRADPMAQFQMEE